MHDFNILGMKVAVTNMEEATNYVLEQSRAGGGYICAANVHMCMESYDNKEFLNVVNGASMVVPDGKPLSWWMRSLGERKAQQVRGPDLFINVCEEASRNNIPIGLYGGSENTLDKLKNYLNYRFPALEISYAFSPPFRELSASEQSDYINNINRTGARILFIGLGCPKQERWMADNKDDVNAVMIGVGAAFDFYAGTKKIAPQWMQTMGIEWLYRLIEEPGRLWKRYLLNNPRYLLLFLITKIKRIIK